MQMLTTVIMWFFNIKGFIQNTINRYIEKTYNTKSILGIQNNKVKSIYLNYMSVLCLTRYRQYIYDTLFHKSMRMLDTELSAIQVVKIVDGVERYIVYDNPTNTQTIQRSIEYTNECIEKHMTINLPSSCIISDCDLVTKDQKIKLKELFAKYAINTNIVVSIEHILRFNYIEWTDETVLILNARKNGKRIKLTMPINEVLTRTVYELYNV